LINTIVLFFSVFDTTPKQGRYTPLSISFIKLLSYHDMLHTS